MIRFESVSYAYQDGATALTDIELEISSGEVVAILGENGAGKTTLVRHINGLLKPTKGRVSVFGVDTKETSIAKLSRKVGIVFQNPDHQLFSDTVENEIAFGLRNFGFSEDVVAKRVDWALKTFDLEEYRSVSPMLLSGGEKKRLCFASVLAWDPEVTILDEPTVGQDLAQKERLTQMITMLSAQAKTVVLVSHDVEFVWPLQPRVIVMARGDIVKDGSAPEIFQDGDVLRRCNVIEPQLVELSSLLKKKPNSPFKDVFEARQWILNNTRSG